MTRKLPTRAELIEYVARAQAGDDDARQQVWIGCHRLVAKIAHGWKFTPPGVDRDDLIQQGMLAIDHAIDKFETDGGYAFTTYAGRAVHNALVSWTRQQGSLIRLPNAWSAAARQPFTTSPLGTSEIDRDFRHEDSAAPAHNYPAHQRAAVQAALNQLTTMQRRVVLDRLAGTKLIELAGLLGVSKERVRQIEREALARLSEEIGQTLPSIATMHRERGHANVCQNQN